MATSNSFQKLWSFLHSWDDRFINYSLRLCRCVTPTWCPQST